MRSACAVLVSIVALAVAGGRPAAAAPPPGRTIDLVPAQVSVQILGRPDKEQLGNDLRVGDINADGRQDLVLGAHWGSIGGRNIQGRAYVTFGRASWPAVLDLGNAAARDWSFMGTGFEARLGSAVATGDLSGDGKADLVLGSVLADPMGQANGGGVYVMFGGPGVGGNVDFLNAEPDAFIAGASHPGGEADRLGTELVVGDFNGDGHGDLAAAAVFRDSFRGAVFVWWGPLLKGQVINLQDAPADWTILGPAPNAYLGSALAAADLNADGIDDLLISAYSPGSAGPADGGAVHVLYGGAARRGTTDLAANLADITVVGPPGSLMGAAQSPGSCSCRGQPLRVADLTGDGRLDLLIGAPLDATRRGSAFLVPGPLAAGVIDLSRSPRLHLAGTATEGRLGWTVAVGHLDGDAALDVVLAAPWATAAGRTTAGLLYGLRGPLPASGEIEVTEATAALVVRGGESGAGNAGATMVLADTNGDGRDDLHVGLPDSAPLGRRSVGEVYVMQGPLLPDLPTPTPTITPTATDTSTPTVTATPTPSATPTATTVPADTFTPTASPSPSPSATPAASATVTRRPTATRRPTPTSGPRRPLYLPFALRSRRRA